jgi:ribosomal protein S18 acetylase RimI-like enzyme
MTNDLILRPAQEADLDVLGEFGAALAAQHRGYDPARFLNPTAEDFRAFFARHLGNPSALLVVAEDREGRVGYAFARWEPPSFVDLADEAPWLHDLYVLPRGRGRGIGAALVNDVAARMRERGAACLRLEVSPKNPTAIHTFEAAGFRTTMLEMQMDLRPLAPR